MRALHLMTAGSVDDGKSTLIGRLLYDTRSIYSDQLAELEHISNRSGSALNLALITDGLRSERQGGITIDVGYRYFETPNRKIILADTPGHLEFTANMIAAASNAEAAIILVDASRTITEQTHRHIILSHLMGIRQFIICINKIDLTGYDRTTFEEFRSRLRPLLDSLSGISVYIIPTSALLGDNIASRSTNTDWYSGPSLLEVLETIPNRSAESSTGSFSVQYSISDTGSLYGGRMLSGSLQVGDTLTHIPSLEKVAVSGLSLANERFIEAAAPYSINIEVSAGFPIMRGDLLLKKEGPLKLYSSAKATLCWLDETSLAAGREYFFQQNANVTRCSITSIHSLLDVRTNNSEPTEITSLHQNDIATATIQFVEPLFLERYTDSRLLGSGIIIDPITNATAGAILIEDLTA